MQYNISHQHWQLYVLNLLKNTLVKLLQPRGILTLSHPMLSWSSQLSCLISKGLSKLPLGLVAVLLLLYATTIQALSATTAQVINGSEPYLTFDGGVTKATTTDALLGITLSDGTAITPENNTSATTPIELPTIGETLADVQMLVPTTTDSIALNDLIGAPYNYWGDDDGDGQGVNGITASGSLSVSITDNMGNQVSRSATLDICKSPYKVALTSTDGSLTTQYGVPNSSNFSGDRATYYISPKATPKICYARPGLFRAQQGATIWNPTKGFQIQSTASSSYSRNFPTTGSNNLHFDLLVSGIDATTLTWPAITHDGITATMTLNPPVDSNFNPDGSSSVRVTFTGPVATTAQHESSSPGSVATPSLPKTFEIVGYDSNNKAVLKYGFVLKQWFVHRGDKRDNYANTSSWCTNLGGGYHLPQIKDLTNALSTPDNTYARNIGAGLFSEWGKISFYTASGFVDTANYWASGDNGSGSYIIHSGYGSILPRSDTSLIPYYGVCTYP